MRAAPNFEFFIEKLPKARNTFRFKPILPQDALKAKQKQKNSKSEKIPACLLKDTAPSVANPLSIIFSKSFKQGKCLDNLNLSRISAIYKGKALNRILTTTGQYLFCPQLPDSLKTSVSTTISSS